MPPKSVKWRRQRRPADEIMEGKSTDFVIAIMGPTGVGKSTFMNHVAGGKEVSPVGHDLVSCTKQLLPYIIEDYPSLRKGQRLVLVDTPGFDDTYIDDAEILRRVAIWLAASYHSEMKLGGIVVLYDISAKRLTHSVRLNIKMVEKLCGEANFDRVVIGTTKWSPRIEEQATLRQEELKNDFWKQLIEKGGQVMRVDNTQESCCDLLNTVLSRVRSKSTFDGVSGSRGGGVGNHAQERILRIQHELVVEEKLVPRTDAGKVLKFSLADILSAKKQELKETPVDSDARKQLEDDITFLTQQVFELRTGFFQRLLYKLF